MSLKKQLIVIFGALAFLLFLGVGVSFWTFMLWRNSSNELQVHYNRNLLLEQIRADMYRAFKEVPDAVTGDDPRSREEFKAFLKPAEESFKTWSELPATPIERANLKTVRIAFDSLVQAAQHAFDLVEAGNKPEAFRFMESNLEDKNFKNFQHVTDAIAEFNNQKRISVIERMHKAQNNAQIVLFVASLGAVALIFLLSAYISSDLFKPLRDIENALENAASGDLSIRLQEERKDEIGNIYAAFNQLLEAIVRKDNLINKEKSGMMPVNPSAPERLTASSQIAIRSLITQVQEKMEYLKRKPNELLEPESKAELLNELGILSQAVEQVVAFGFPQELKLSGTDISRLLYDVLLRYQEFLIERSVSLEFDVDPAVGNAMVDKLKLAEAVSALLKNAIDSLPETGGKLGIRARLDKEKSRLLIEVADNGATRKKAENDEFEDETEKPVYAEIGLNLAKTIIEQHEGQIREINNQEQGNYVRIDLPLIISG